MNPWGMGDSKTVSRQDIENPYSVWWSPVQHTKYAAEVAARSQVEEEFEKRVGTPWITWLMLGGIGLFLWYKL